MTIYEKPKPKSRKVVLTARDVSGDGRVRSKSVTVYDATPDQVIEQYKRCVGGSNGKREKANAS